MKNYLKIPSIALFAITCLFGLQTSLFGQGLTTSGITGTVLDSSGSAISGANVTIVHVPTGTIDRVTTGNTGRYNVRGLRIGGPYSVTVSSNLYRTTVQNNIYIELSKTANVSFEMPDSSGEVVELDEFEVIGINDPLFNPDKTGVGTILNQEALSTRPQINRSLNDFARFDPNAVLVGNTSETGFGALSVAGQNAKYNSIQVDGVKMNDQFGLSSDGLPSLGNPVSIDALEEISIEVAPYDVRQSGFTGGSINAVTKSGTNTFHGSALYIKLNDDNRGENVNTGVEPQFEETTWGLTLSGPIIKDKLFFFVSYEEFERISQPSNPGFFPDPVLLEEVRNTINSRYGFDPGTFGGLSSTLNSDEKITVKIDWNVNEKHRLSLRWNNTEGVSPSVADFDDSSNFSPETAFSSVFFDTTFINDAWVGQWFARWTPNIRSEFRFGVSRFQTDPENPNVFPEFRIDDFPGTQPNGSPTTRGELFWGADDSRQSNFLDTDVKNASFSVDITVGGSHTITTGFDWEETKFNNLFLQETYGELEFQGIEGFRNDELDFIVRQTGIQGLPIAAESDFTVLGFFLQDRWDVSDRLIVNFGLRYDTFSTDTPPTENSDYAAGFGSLGSVSGFAVPATNTNTLEGADLFAPRFSFNYAVDSDRKTQIRGGFGLFQGRNPGVWLSNVYSNNGVTTRSFFDGSPSYTSEDYIAGNVPGGNPVENFDPNNPVVFLDLTSAPDTGDQRLDLLADNLEMPSAWKANFAIDRKLPWLGGMEFTFEWLQTWINQGLGTIDLNLLEVGTAPDGRTVFNGAPDRDRGNVAGFDNVFMLVNTGSVGKSTNLNFIFRRPVKDHWFFNVSYTLQDANDVSRQGSSTAKSNFADTVKFNQNAFESSTARNEIKHRILAVAGIDFELLKEYKTTVQIVYEGRSGRPFSYLFGDDVNGDDDSFPNDLLYVPTGMTDPLADFSRMTDAETTAFFAFLDSSGLNKFAGTNAPRNAFNSKWIHRFDMHVAQEIPVRGRLKAEVFIDFINFMNFFNDKAGIIDRVSFQTSTISGGEVSGSGQFQYEFSSAPGSSDQVRDSRWSLQTGIKLKF